MSVSQKHRRKLVYKGKTYFWYVSPDGDFFDRNVLHVLSEDKALILACLMEAATPYVVSMGRMFQGAKTDGRYHRYLLPFRIPGAVTPKFICSLLAFALEGSGAERVEPGGGLPANF